MNDTNVMGSNNFRGCTNNIDTKVLIKTVIMAFILFFISGYVNHKVVEGWLLKCLNNYAFTVCGTTHIAVFSDKYTSALQLFLQEHNVYYSLIDMFDDAMWQILVTK